MRSRIAVAILAAAIAVPTGLAATTPKKVVSCTAQGAILRCAPESGRRAAPVAERLSSPLQSEDAAGRRKRQVAAALIILAQSGQLPH